LVADARQPGTGEQVIRQEFAPEILYLLGLGEEAMAADVEPVVPYTTAREMPPTYDASASQTTGLRPSLLRR
jgi:hypothetical protein